MVTYPGLPVPRIAEHLSREASTSHYAEGTTFQIGRIEMIANTGTYVDAPFHRYEGGVDLAGLPLERLVDLEGICLKLCERRVIDADAFESVEVEGRAVLVRTDWSRHFGTPAYAQGHPHLTQAAAELLVERGAALVGIDSLNIDGTEGGERPVHGALLAAGIPIVEHMTALDELPAAGFRFFAVPARVRGMGSFPVCAFALLEL